ncbi:MAG: hypothetical protein PHC97_03880 [Patescibacteria group bacterium]|nr:hypothetical protein [Patescibacteria group bacterium]
MPNIEFPPKGPSADQKIADLQKAVEEIEVAQKQAGTKFETVPGKKEKIAPIKMELPDVKEKKSVEFVKDDKGKFHFEYVDANKQKRYLTQGDLLSDMEWGVYYDLNHEVIAAEYRKKYDKFRKRYQEAFYQQKIEKLMTEQLLIQRLEVDNIADKDYYLGQAYAEVYKRLKNESEAEGMSAGFLFEKMIGGILNKIAVDLGEKWKFSMQKTSVVEDVELKTDLVVNLPERNRGVGVEESKKAKGIQLTLIEKGNEKFRRKVDQVQKIKERIKKSKGLGEPMEIDDLVLLEVEVGNQDILSKYSAWLRNNKSAGGPESYFTVNQIMEFLGGIFKESDLDFETNKDFKEEVWQYFKNK